MTKKIFILFGIVIVLGLIVLVVEKPTVDRFSLNSEKKIYPALKTEDITAVEIEYFTRGTRLEKGSDGEWTAQSKKTDLLRQIEEAEKNKKAKEDKTKPKGKKKEGKKDKDEPETQPKTEEDIKYPADPKKIKGLLETLAKLDRNMLVTSNPDKQNTLELGPSGLQVTLFNSKGAKVVKLLVGKQGPNLFSTFVRDENENNVYLVDEYLKGTLNMPLEGWKKDETDSQNQEIPDTAE